MLNEVHIRVFVELLEGISKAALHLTNQEIKRVELKRSRPDGLLVGSLRNSSSMKN